MLEWIFELITNPFLITAIFAWFIAQVSKTIIYYILNRKIRLERLIGDGGMPSGHSATVCSMAALSLLMFGPGSYEFGLSTMRSAPIRCQPPHCLRKLALSSSS